MFRRRRVPLPGARVNEWLRRISQSRTNRGWPASLAIALVCVLLATAVRLIFGWLIGPTLPFATYFPAIMVAALVGGSVAGIIAIVASVIVVWWTFTPPFFEFNPLTLQQLADIALFGFSAGLIVWLAVVYRNLLRALEDHETQRQLLVG